MDKDKNREDIRFALNELKSVQPLGKNAAEHVERCRNLFMNCCEDFCEIHTLDWFDTFGTATNALRAETNTGKYKEAVKTMSSNLGFMLMYQGK